MEKCHFAPLNFEISLSIPTPNPANCLGLVLNEGCYLQLIVEVILFSNPVKYNMKQNIAILNTGTAQFS